MFRLVDVGFWDDPQVARLPREEKLVTICLFTCIHTQPCGVYRIAIDRIASMTKIPEATVAKIMRHLAEADIAHYDGTEVCIPGFIRRQRYKGPQMARRCATGLAQVKNADYVRMIEERYPDFLKMGGHKARRHQEQRDLPAIAEDMPTPLGEEVRKIMKPKKKGKAASIADLAIYIAEKLRLTAGIKKGPLEDLVAAEGGDFDRVRAAADRAAKYFETAKAERWKSFVIARRFSKFLEFYDSTFSDDAVLDAYIAQIREANERERRADKRDAALQVGAPRPEPEAPEDPWPAFMLNLPEQLEPLRADFQHFQETRKGAAKVEDKMVALFNGDQELEHKVAFFTKGLAEQLRTPATIRTYRLNYIRGKFGVPELEEGK